MLKIKLYSMYDDFPEFKPAANESHINLYVDYHLTDCTGPEENAVALLMEPRSLLPDMYKFAEEHSTYFRYIFTHDSKLLKLPNAIYFMWANTWLTTDSEKTEGISLCTSPKDWCWLHKVRNNLADYFEDDPRVDVFRGEWDSSTIPYKPKYEPKDYLEHYKFSIIIENDIDELWFTEKILNCFSTKTVPIYLGATHITDIFNEDGIIRVNDAAEIIRIVRNLDIEHEYLKRREAIEDNFNRVIGYKTKWRQRFLNLFSGILEDIQK